MRVLVITPNFPPLANPRAFRWQAVTAELARLGHDVDVVTVNGAEWDCTPVLDGVRVHRTGWLGSVVPRINGSHTSRGNSNPLASRWLQRSLAFGWKQVHWPDYACGWLLAGRRLAARLLCRRRHDVLITVSNPYTSHLIGLALKRRHPSLGWLVDLGDPFSPLPSVPVNNALLYGWLNRWVERSVLQHSSAVAVTTQRTADLYLAAFPRCRDKLRVIPPLLSAPPAARAEPFFSQTGARRLVFVGSLYRRIRDPRLVLATLDQLLRTPLGTNLELHFVGKVDECRSDFAAYDHLLGRKVILHGPVERSVALQAMREADVLVSIGNATDCQLPSKLVEYVGSGKPIVNFASSLHDSSAEFLRDYPARLCVGQRVADAHSPDFRKLLDFLAVAWTPIEPSRLAAILAPYLPERIGAAYAACLEETLRDKE